MDIVALFFSEVWAHRRNRFIAVGGIAVAFFALTLVVMPIPWIPESLKETTAVLCGISAGATMLLMVYYALKFAVLGATWVGRKAVRAIRPDPPDTLSRPKLSQ